MLHVMPDSTVFADTKIKDGKNFKTSACWPSRFLWPPYRKERKVHEKSVVVPAAIIWFAKDLGVARADLNFIGIKVVIRSEILVRSGDSEEFSSRFGFARLIDKIRSQHKAGRKWRIAKTLLDDVPPTHRDIAEKSAVKSTSTTPSFLANQAMPPDLPFNQIDAGCFVQESKSG